jgi:hypothetical protein
MPNLWDTNPHGAFSTPDERPDPAPSDHDDPSRRSGPRMTAAFSGCPPTS